MRGWFVLVAVGVVILVAGVWVATGRVVFNLGNNCGADGCMNVSGSLPVVAPGALLIIAGFLITAYGASKRKGVDE